MDEASGALVADSQASGHPAVKGSTAGLGLAALGVVFGDIGTSPLYTLKTVLDTTGANPAPAMVLGAFSLLVWTLVIVTTVKYVLLAMRVDNDGEGGILALMSLLGVKRHRRPIIIAAGLFGAALIYGDGAITPAISVLSALEGLSIATHAVDPYILPATVAILVALFAIQPQGTARIGRTFGPIMALWFVLIAGLGIWGILRHPAVLAGLNPVYGALFLAHGGITAFFVLGAVFLCVTGAEALYADMGHFGAGPIRLAWNGLVFPALVLNYAGQSAIVLDGAPTDGNIFFRLCPPAMLVPLVVLATVATVIASQSIITGAFSMTRQAIQLGWLPLLKIKQTSAEGYGQIYVGAVNWLLMLATIGLTLAFRKSDNLAAAYGIAVSLTMLMTTVLLFIAMREIWRWPIALAGLAAGLLFVVDLAFFGANLAKVADGGYVPLVLASLIYLVMYIWHRGAQAVAEKIRQDVVPIGEFMAMIEEKRIPRVPGTALYLTRTESDAPPVMIWNLKHNRSLHERLFVMTIKMQLVPWVRPAERLAVQSIAPHFWRAEARYGFMERPDIPGLLEAATLGPAACDLTLDDVVYFVGHETVLHDTGKAALPLWIEAPFAVMERNAAHVTDYFHLPCDRVVEIGRQVAV